MKSMASLVNMTIVVIIMMTMIGRRMMTMMMGRTLMKTWRHAGVALIPGSWIQVDLGTSLACSHLPQSENEDHGVDDIAWICFVND